jgi:hypothetical protein
MICACLFISYTYIIIAQYLYRHDEPDVVLSLPVTTGPAGGTFLCRLRTRTHLKNGSKAPLRRCRLAQNAHILPVYALLFRLSRHSLGDGGPHRAPLGMLGIFNPTAKSES